VQLAHNANSAADAIETDALCLGCGYNLRGITSSHACPECALPASASLDGHRLSTIDQTNGTNVKRATSTAISVITLRTIISAIGVSISCFTISTVLNLWTVDCKGMRSSSRSAANIGLVAQIFSVLCAGILVHQAFDTSTISALVHGCAWVLLDIGLICILVIFLDAMNLFRATHRAASIHVWPILITFAILTLVLTASMASSVSFVMLWFVTSCILVFVLLFALKVRRHAMILIRPE